MRVDLLWPCSVLAEQELFARVAPLHVPSNRVHHVAWEGEHEDLIVFAWDELCRPLFEPFLYRAIDDELGRLGQDLATYDTALFERLSRGGPVSREDLEAAAAFAGRDGGKLRGLADPLLVVPAQSTRRIQEMHILLGHMLCGALEIRLGLVDG